MSADNYLLIMGNKVYMRFASCEEAPLGRPLYVGTDREDARSWAFAEALRGWYEYGVSEADEEMRDET